LITSQANTEYAKKKINSHYFIFDYSNIKIWDLRKVSLERPKMTINKTKIKKPSNSSFTLNHFSYLENKIRKMNEDAESLKINISNIDYFYFMYFLL